MTNATYDAGVTYPWRKILAALSASLIGIGLARFAYTPLIPVLISHHWFSATGTFYLGAANLAGYLAGALLAARLVHTFGGRRVLNTMMLLASLSFIACMVPVDFLWFFVWRFLSGLTGGALMVTAAPAVLPHVSDRLRGHASGLIFTGVGLGAVLSGTLVPELLRFGLPVVWGLLGVVSLLLTAISWSAWPSYNPVRQARPQHPREKARALRLIYVQYGLNAAALVPHMVFLVAFVDKATRHGFTAGTTAWIFFGLGAMLGPFSLGVLADRFGFDRIFRLGLAVQAIGIGVLAVSTSYPVILLSAFIAGAYTPGIVPLVLGRVRETLSDEPAHQQRAWGAATAAFAVMQAVGAYGLSFLYAQTGNYRLIFLIGALCAVLAFVTNLVARATRGAA